VQCPSCGSSDITYTCEPTCCFNHICDRCYTTFELFTEPLGQKLGGIETAPRARDSLAPTVACAQCGSLEVYRVIPEAGASGALVCLDCHAVLQLGFSGIESR
jgi:hypothetical protein